MRQITAFIMALALCILAMPAMAEDEEPSEPNTLLSPDDNIWIAISPMEVHPMYIDRPYAIIPTIPEYPIRVAVYGNPYNYSIINSTTGLAELVTIVDDGEQAVQDFEVSSLQDLKITLRRPDKNDRENRRGAKNFHPNSLKRLQIRICVLCRRLRSRLKPKSYEIVPRCC